MSVARRDEEQVAASRRLARATTPVRELRDSLLLLALAASSMGASVGLALAAVKVFATQ